MARDFIPHTDADLLAWGDNFSTLISANPTGYSLTAAIATELAGKQAAYASALAAATNPPTRGGATIHVKDEARTDLVAYCRQLARVIQGSMIVTNAQRYNLGLTVKDQTPSPINPPTEPPVLEVASVTGRMLKLVLREQGSERRGKPAGVAGATLFSYIGATPPASLRDWTNEGMVTRTNFDFEFAPTVAAGSQVWLCACWYSPRAQPGPTCLPISTYLGGGVSAAA